MSTALVARKPDAELEATPGTPAVPFDTTILAGQLAPASLAMYQRDFAAYVAWATQHRAEVLDPATLGRWRTHLAGETQLSPNTINRMLSAVKRLIKEAAAQGYSDHETAIAFSRVVGVKHKALKTRTKAHARTRISAADMRRLCTAPDTTTLVGCRDAALLATLASSGLRVGEVAGLRVGQIEPREGGYLLAGIVGKNQTEGREAPLSREAHRLIQQWLTRRPVSSDFLFTSFAGRGNRATAKPISAAAVWQLVQGYAQQLGLDHIKPHDFRRFVGTRLAKERGIRAAQMALGHKNIATTAAHYDLSELEAGMTDDLY
jgi:site-specific recombinase XerD